MLLMFALIIISTLLLPMLYMVTTAFQQPGQSTTPGRTGLAGLAADGAVPGPGLPGLHGPVPGRDDASS